MFTGIIKQQTAVAEKTDRNGILTIFFRRPPGLKLQNGRSLNLNGICSTVKKLGRGIFEVDYMPETRKKTTVNQWQKGTAINLEESVRPTTFLDGHIVQGHIDGLGKVGSIIYKGDSKVITIRAPAAIMKFISVKGSVAVDGVSLTVVQTKTVGFSVALIPYSLKHTNLGKLKKGDAVNIETDIIARYLRKLLNH